MTVPYKWLSFIKIRNTIITTIAVSENDEHCGSSSAVSAKHPAYSRFKIILRHRSPLFLSELGMSTRFQMNFSLKGRFTLNGGSIKT